ncbi:Rox3-domain-containing protein [Xylariaceae sp. FL0662B]|nr:Rox3-domain-containing protein [Xylariaceae sp. FL0662B]
MATMSFNPQTPQSPSRLSPGTTDQLSSINSSMTSITTALPTPAHSVNGSGQLADMAHDVTMADDYSHKRKYPFDDTGHVQKKVHLEDTRKIGIENLHMDVGEKYLLCRTRHSGSVPRMSDDLFEKFGLTGIAASVARTKPNGEKNALRKGYKGQIKSLGLSGHFDAVKKESFAEDSFMALINHPEDDWLNREVRGKEVEGGLPHSCLANLSRATTMAKSAPLQKPLWDSSVLGDLASGIVSKKTGQDQAARQTAPGTPVTSALGVTPKPTKPLAPQADRARRIGKKRSYQDSSFEGYGEGYDDETGGSSTGDGDDRSKLKRRKQVHANHPSSRSLFTNR